MGTGIGDNRTAKRAKRGAADASTKDDHISGAKAESTQQPLDAAVSRELGAARSALEILFGPPESRPFAVRFWTGDVDGPVEPPPSFTLGLNHAGTLRRMLRPPFELSICQAFIAGDYEIEGSVEGAAGMGENLRGDLASPAKLARLTQALRALPTDDTPAAFPEARAPESGSLHTPERDAAAVRSHYDVGNDFYKLWLDKRMVYSCAYFTTPHVSLDDAQEAKLEHICRKLRLAPNEKLLDVGCGWGGLIMHAADRFGVNATGITLSYEQAALARDRIRERGLESRCIVEVRDYRHLTAYADFDKIASVGMVEHVGRAKLPIYFERLFSYLKPGGLLLNHGIVHEAAHGKPRLRDRVLNRLWGDNAFINEYVFPDGELPEVSEVVATAEAAGFELRDAESLREHYVLTLRHWVRNLEREKIAAIESAGEEIYRIWRLYMAASAFGFASGRLTIQQLLLAKRSETGVANVPLTRDDIYV
ncbi:MAG: cyclopropane-fatty-acyl-phospholipid synthase family protein [Gemmatimonadota bacterium]|nr:cyclopropane-fatty-acyl-phospholipid synthase family protein [Gemmatimonadota bacterium]